MLVDKYIKAPHNEPEHEYISFIETVVKENNIDLIICVLDSDLPILQSVKNRNESTIYISPSEDVIKLFRDKLQSSIAVSRLGISIPEIILDDAFTEIICRKRISVGSSGIHNFNIATQFDYEPDMAFLQKKVSGDEYTVDVMCDKYGYPHIIIPRKRIEIRNGMSFKTALIRDFDIIETVECICKEFYLPGLWFSNMYTN